MADKDNTDNLDKMNSLLRKIGDSNLAGEIGACTKELITQANNTLLNELLAKKQHYVHIGEEVEAVPIEAIKSKLGDQHE